MVVHLQEWDLQLTDSLGAGDRRVVAECALLTRRRRGGRRVVRRRVRLRHRLRELPWRYERASRRATVGPERPGRQAREPAGRGGSRGIVEELGGRDVNPRVTDRVGCTVGE